MTGAPAVDHAVDPSVDPEVDLSESGVPPRLGFRPSFDGIRGVAIAAVMVAHLGEFVVPGARRWLLPGGFLGVDLFFVLSGFLITALLLGDLDRRGHVRFRRFYARRAARLLPALLAFFAVHALVTWLVFGDPMGKEGTTILWSLGLVANWQLSFGVQPPLDLLHLWTLAVEAQFYLVWPLVLTALRRWLDRLDVLLGVLAGAVVAGAVLRALEYGWWDDPGKVYTRTGARMDPLILGALAAVLWRAGRLDGRVVRSGAAVGAAVVAASMVLIEPGTPMLFDGWFTVVGAAGAVVVLGALDERFALTRVLEWRPARLVGRMSYSLYLWHLPAYFWVIRKFDGWGIDSGLARCAGALALTAVLSTASYLAVERPFLHRRG